VGLRVGLGRTTGLMSSSSSSLMEVSESVAASNKGVVVVEERVDRRSGVEGS